MMIKPLLYIGDTMTGESRPMSDLRSLLLAFPTCWNEYLALMLSIAVPSAVQRCASLCLGSLFLPAQ